MDIKLQINSPNLLEYTAITCWFKHLHPLQSIPAEMFVFMMSLRSNMPVIELLMLPNHFQSEIRSLLRNK